MSHSDDAKRHRNVVPDSPALRDAMKRFVEGCGLKEVRITYEVIDEQGRITDVEDYWPPRSMAKSSRVQ